MEIQRYEKFQTALEQKNFFKLVCGAGNSDFNWVEKLAFVYTVGGALSVDVAADEEVVKKAKAGIEKGVQYLRETGKFIETEPMIIVSVGIPGDHHIRKAFINDKCVECNLCIAPCPTDAIPQNLVVVPELCIGCGACEAACHFNAIDYSDVTHDLSVFLPKLFELGAEAVELHASAPDKGVFEKEWSMVKEVAPEAPMFLSLDRKYLSNLALEERIDYANTLAEGRLIIQADGVPMGGISNDPGKTLQTVAIAQQIDFMFTSNKKKTRKHKNFKVILSGGTNSHTYGLAESTKTRFHGIAVGTYARDCVNEFISKDNFWNDTENIEKAIMAAKEVVSVSVNSNVNVRESQ